MTKDELKKYDGKEGRPAYVAYKGKIYDVTDSKMWKMGSHMNRHFAGEDLTDQMAVAPHEGEVMERFKLVDTLEVEETVDREFDKMEKMRAFYRTFHPHPVMIHFPMGLFFFTALMQLLFFIFRNPSLESSAYYSLFVSVLFAFPATISGIFSWWINYQKILTPTFKVKLYLSILLLIIGTITLLMRIFIPGISASGGVISIIYNVLLFSCMPIIFIIGYHGGKITWPS